PPHPIPTAHTPAPYHSPAAESPTRKTSSANPETAPAPADSQTRANRNATETPRAHPSAQRPPPPAALLLLPPRARSPPPQNDSRPHTNPAASPSHQNF